MSKCLTAPREIEARKIVRVEPLENRGVVTLSGVSLLIEGGSKVRWTMPNPLENTPQPGDFLVRDDELNLDFIVPAAKFDKVFQPAVAA